MTGELLRAAMQDAGLRRKQAAVMPALRCQPLLTGSKKPKITSLRACAPFLYRALHQLRAPRALALGEAAAKSLLNSSKPPRIVKLRGRVQTLETEGNSYQWWATYSIHDALKNPQLYTRLVEDMAGIIRSPELFRFLTERHGDVLARDADALDYIIAGSVRIKA